MGSAGSLLVGVSAVMIDACSAIGFRDWTEMGIHVTSSEP